MPVKWLTPVEINRNSIVTDSGFHSDIEMVKIATFEGMNHNHMVAYADLVWNYFKEFSRNVKTGEVIYSGAPWDGADEQKGDIYECKKRLPLFSISALELILHTSVAVWASPSKVWTIPHGSTLLTTACHGIQGAVFTVTTRQTGSSDRLDGYGTVHC